MIAETGALPVTSRLASTGPPGEARGEAERWGQQPETKNRPKAPT